MEALATTSKLLLEAGRAFSGLRDYFRDDESFQILAQDLGWDLAELPAPLANLLPVLEQLENRLLAVVQDPSLTTLAAAQTALTTAYAALQDLAQQTYTFATVDAAAFKNEFPQQLINLALVDYLAQRHSRIYAVLLGAGLITREVVPATISRLSYLRKSFNLQALAALLQQPTDIWKTLYGWGTDFAYGRLALVVTEMLNRLGWDADIANADYELLTSVNPLPLPVPLPTTKAVYVSLFDRDTDRGELHLSAQLLPVLNAAGNYEGLALAVQALGTVADTIDLGSQFELSLTGGASLTAGLCLQIQPNQELIIKALSSAAAVSGKVEVALQRLPGGVAGTPQLLLRTPGNTELTYETITWKVGVLASTTAGADFYTELKISALRFASGEGDNDSFLSQVLKSFNFETDLSVGLSKAKGFYFDLSGGLTTRQTKNIFLGPVHLTNVGFAVETANGFTYLTVGSDVQAELGPFQVNISGLGLKAGLRYSASGGNIGPFSTDIAFKQPTSLGISVETDAVTGGGLLYFDPANYKYAGVATLNIKNKIKVNALGLLQTQLPNNRPGYSFLLLITAEFTPIQLGLGFKLSGIGGLVGINRTANTDYLRGVVRRGEINSLLFPRNVLDNPGAALATADASFPATEGRYVFGLMAKIEWGTPALITLDMGVIIELPAPVRLIVLGSLQAVLPDKNKAILRLRADFVGVVDFGAKTAAFDATLVDSRILSYTLTGDMAFRLHWGDQPVFILTAGGFHPAFQPPANANLPTLRRLTLALANSNDFRLILQTYLAVTSNTVQIGARLDLFVDLPFDFYVEGYLYFDTLFQFNPFRLALEIGAGVAVKRKGKTKLSLHLRLAVSGPAPWHVNGEISFKIIFKVKFRINRSFGGGAAPQPLPDVRVRELYLEALANPANWEVEVPASGTAGTVALRGAADPARLLVDPSGALVVRQKVLPLGYRMERYGNARPVGGNQFSITSVQLGTGANVLVLPATALGEIADFFAPSQFRQMRDAEKLSAPSFQAMRSGVRVNALKGFEGGNATVQKAEYELIVLGATPATDNGIVAEANAAIAAPASEQRKRVSMPAEQFQQLAKNSAIGRSYEQATPSFQAPEQVYWREDNYALARASTFTRYGTVFYPNEAEATAALQKAVRDDPGLGGELLVVPAYQLELESV
jgi:hypothetical protein